MYIHLVKKEQLKDKEKYMEISSSQIKSVAQFRHVLEDYYKNDNLKKLILMMQEMQKILILLLLIFLLIINLM